MRATGALLCSECGRLTWPEAAATSPHRASAQDEFAVPCPHCTARAWIDLRRESTALAIREGEQGVAQSESASVDTLRKAGLGVIFGSFVGVIATSSVVAGLTIAGLCGLAAGLAAVRLRKISVPAKRTLPDRWALALPPSQEPERHVQGSPRVDELIRSPLTGRACLAYEVGLREDDDAAGELHSWALLEQRVAAFEVDGVSVEPEETFVEVARERLGAFSTEELDAPAIEWLTERGFSAVGSTLVVYESIVPPDVQVSLGLSSGSATLRRVGAQPPALAASRAVATEA